MRYSKAVLKSFIFFALFIYGYSSRSQTVVTVGTGTTSISEKYPFDDFYNYSWSNVIYLSSEIGQGGQITKLGFNVYNNSTVTMANQKIYARHTTATSYTTGAYPTSAGFTLIYDGSITYSGIGWKTITLTTPFTYNGTDNLELLFENRNAVSSSNFPYFYVTTGYPSNRTRRDFQDASFPTSCATCSAVPNIPNTQFTIGCSTTMSVTPTTVTICNGSSTTLSASGVSTYTWSPASGLNTTTSASVTANPTATTVYTVTGKDANNCTQTKTTTVTVNALPTLSTNPSSPALCIGSSLTVTASGATNYTWSPGTGLNTTTSATVTANPTVTTTYTLTGKDANNCTNTKSVTITVNVLPAISLNPSSPTICSGSSQVLTASGASTYTWNPGTGLSSTTGATVTATPTITTAYTVTGTNANSCVNANVFTVTVNSNPSVSVTPSSATICSGSSTALTASGASTYSWSPSTGLSSTIGATVTASSTATTTYSVTGTNAVGCVNTKTVVVTVNSIPSLTITPSSTTICQGNSANLTASGASTYSWSPSTGLNTTTGATVTATPTATTTYTINATGSNGCTNSTTVVVTVNGNPSVSISPTSTTVCNGGSTGLTASGATTYTWSPSTGLNTSSGASVTANPTGTTIYTVTGTTSGCTGTATSTVSVAFVNAGTAQASGGTDPCSNGQVSLSLSGTKTTTVGTGTATSVNYPFNGFYDNSWSDVIYLQSDLGAAGNITKLSFYVDNAPSNYTMTAQQIYIKSTSATSFSSAIYPTTSGFTQVYNGTITYNGSGWKTITLGTPFSYDGTSNIEVLYENHDGTWASGYPVFRYTAASVTRTRRDYSDGSFPSSCSSCSLTVNVPNTQFTVDRTLGSFVKWQSSTDNVTYTDITGGTTQNYSVTVGTSSYFRAQVTSGSCPAAYSDPVYYATKNRYYVNDNSTIGDVFTTAVGSSSNDGRDKARPKASINAIITTYTLGPCDTIFVDKGTYTEEVDVFFGDGGNSSGYTVIHGAGIDQAVLTAPVSKYNMYLGQPDYIKVEGFTMNSTQASYPNVIITEAENNVIANNKLTHSATTNIQVFGDNLDANNNQIISNTITNSSTGGNAILIWGNADNATITTNTITMSNVSSKDAIVITTYATGSGNNTSVYYPVQGLINNNNISAYSYGISLYGYDHPISTYTLSNNIITMQAKTVSDGAPIWLAGVGATNLDQSIIFNNRLIGGKNGIFFGSSADNTRIYNNYISNSDYGMYVNSNTSDIGELYFNSFYNQITNLYFASSSNAYWKVKNNILYSTNSTNTNANISVGTSMTFVACDYNLFYAPNGASIGRVNSTNYPTLTSWQNIDHADETTKGDEHSITGNPNYTDVANNNLDALGTTPAALTGVALTGITTDIYNHARNTLPSIGAEEPIPTANAGADATICFGASAQLQGSGGINYSWQPTAGLSNPNISNPIASPTVTTAYTLTVSDGNESTTDVLVVNVNPLPNITITASPRPGIYSVNGTVTLTASGASTYTWATTTSLSSLSSATVIANPTINTIYTLTGTDNNSCVNTQTINIIYSPLDVFYKQQNIESNAANNSAYILLSGIHGQPPYTYKWEDNSAEGNRYNLIPGTYSVVVRDSLQDSIQKSFVIGTTPKVLLNQSVSINNNTFTNNLSSFGQTGSVSYANTIDPGDEGWLDFVINDTNTNFFLGFNNLPTDSSETILNGPVVTTTSRLFSRNLIKVYQDLIPTLDTLPSPYPDSVKVVERILMNHAPAVNTSSLPLSNYLSVGIQNSQLLIYVNGITFQKPISVQPNDNLRIGISGGTPFAKLNGNNLIITPGATGPISVSPQLYLQSSSLQLGHFVGSFSKGNISTLSSSCLTDVNMNYVETITYDESGNVVSNTKVYSDYLGRTVQTQTRVLSQNNILAMQNLFDGFGRIIGQTLPAPIYSSTFCFQPNFVTNSSGSAYTFTDFDHPNHSTAVAGDVDLPNAVGNTTQGTLGWYYSNNNTSEPFVASSGFPYTRIEYYPDALAKPKRVSGAGENHRMGTGHENKVFYTTSGGELEYFYGYHGSYELNPDFTPQSVSNNNLNVFKTISLNADDQERVTYTNSSGKVIASCISGGNDACYAMNISQPIPHELYGSVLIHLPKINNNSLKLPAVYTDCPYPANSSGNICNQIITTITSPGYNLANNYKIIDVMNDHLLLYNTDYTINSTTRAVTFLGSYANRSLFLRLSYKYPLVSGVSMPKLIAQYELDYNNWTLNYYDVKGEFIASIAPNDVNCVNTLGTVSTNYNSQNVDVCHTSASAYEDGLNAYPNTAPPSGDQYPLYPYNRYECNYLPAYQKSFTGNAGAITHASVSMQLVPNPNLTSSTQRSTNPNQQYAVSRTVSSAGVTQFMDTIFVAPDTILLQAISKHPLLSDNLLVDSLMTFNVPYFGTDSTSGTSDTLYDNLAASRLTNSSFRIDYWITYNVSVAGVLVSPPPVMHCYVLPDLNINTAPVIFTEPPISINLSNTSIPTSGVNVVVTPIDIQFSVQGYPNLSGPYGMCEGSGGPPLPPLGTNLVDWFNLRNALNYDFKLNVSSEVDVLFNAALQSKFSKKITYDRVGNVVSTENPDEGRSDFVYDNEDKLRFSQNDKQRVTGGGGKFTYVNYDRAGRPLETGEYNPLTPGCGSCANPYYFRTLAQNLAGTNLAPSGQRDIFTDINLGYQILIPDGRTSQQTYSYYDEADATLSSQISGYSQKHLTSKVSKTYNANSVSWYSYDELGRLTWTIQKTYDAILGNPVKTYNYTYDLNGKVLQTAYNKENSSEAFYHKFDYDADQRLISASTSFNGTNWTLQDAYSYYLHGPLKREEIQGTLQGIDYVYTIQGMLKSINHPSLNSLYDPGQDNKTGSANSGFKKDIFGFAIDYYSNDYSRSGTNVQSYAGGTNLFGGSIKAVRWQTQNPLATIPSLMYPGQQLMYKYNYDDFYRLKEADFGTYASATGAITMNVLTDYKTDNLSYDRNGNIKTLRRNSQNNNFPAPAVTMDDLTYNYDAIKTNRLNQVSDAQASVPLSPDVDLPDQPNSGNYTYNEIGQVTDNAQEGTHTYYDVYGQVTSVTKTTGSSTKKLVRFVYNDKGMRSAKISYDGNGNKATQLNYMYDASGQLACTYATSFNTTTPDSTVIISGPSLQDYVVYGASRLGTYDVASATNFYEMSDHLGNVRAVYKNNGTGVEVVSFTDYYPHGGVMPGRNYVGSPNYRYAYQGQEKDAETGLLNFELRQFDARLGRWFAPDPMGQYHSPYLAMGNNPVSMVDPTGGLAHFHEEGCAADNYNFSEDPSSGNFGHQGGVTYEVDGMIVSEFAFNNITGANGGKNVRSMSYGGLAVGTVLGYSVNGKNYYGSHAYANASASQQAAFAAAGIVSVESKNGTEYYTKYNLFPVFNRPSETLGSGGVLDVTDNVNGILSKNSSNDMIGGYQQSFKFVMSTSAGSPIAGSGKWNGGPNGHGSGWTLQLSTNNPSSVTSTLGNFTQNGMTHPGNSTFADVNNRLTAKGLVLTGLTLTSVEAAGSDMGQNYTYTLTGPNINQVMTPPNAGADGIRPRMVNTLNIPLTNVNMNSVFTISLMRRLNAGGTSYDGCQYAGFQIHAIWSPRK